MRRFEGLTILVTGATGGFGRRLCERLAEAGARLVLSDVDAGPVQAFAATLPTELTVTFLPQAVRLSLPPATQ